MNDKNPKKSISKKSKKQGQVNAFLLDKTKYETNGTWLGIIANEMAENNRLLRIMIYCYLKTHLQIGSSTKKLEEESLELLGDTAKELESQEE